MLLLELFNQPVDYKSVPDGYGGTRYEFEIGGKEYHVIVTDGIARTAEIFAGLHMIADHEAVEASGWFDQPVRYHEFEFAQVSDSGSYLHHITGDVANAAQVFSTVIKILQDEVIAPIRGKKDQVVIMSAKERSRVKLYDRLAKRFGTDVKKFDGHEVIYAFRP